MSEYGERGYREGVWAGLPNYIAEDGYSSLSENEVRKHVAIRRLRAGIASLPDDEPESFSEESDPIEVDTPLEPHELEETGE